MTREPPSGTVIRFGLVKVPPSQLQIPVVEYPVPGLGLSLSVYCEPPETLWNVGVAVCELKLRPSGLPLAAADRL